MKDCFDRLGFSPLYISREDYCSAKVLQHESHPENAAVSLHSLIEKFIDGCSSNFFSILVSFFSTYIILTLNFLFKILLFMIKLVNSLMETDVPIIVQQKTS